MATPIILKTGTISGPGTPGQGSNDLDIGETVVLTDTVVGNAGLPHVTEFEDVPIGSALTVLTDDTTETPSFIPDITGSYRVKMTVDGVDYAVEIFAVPLPKTGKRIPSFQETAEYDGAGNAKGWHQALTAFMRIIDDDYQVISSHAPTHIRGATDEIDGDKIDIDWAPSNYTRDVSPPQVTNVEHLTSNLKGIDDKLGQIPGASGDKFNFQIRVGDVAIHDSATPLVVSQFQLDPSQFTLTNATLAIKFRAIAGNGAASIVTNVRLYSLSDTEYIGTGLSFTVQDPTYEEETIPIGSGAGEIDNSSKMYEVRIWVTAPTDPSHKINLGSAELSVIATIS